MLLEPMFCQGANPEWAESAPCRLMNGSLSAEIVTARVAVLTSNLQSVWSLLATCVIADCLSVLRSAEAALLLSFRSRWFDLVGTAAEFEDHRFGEGEILRDFAPVCVDQVEVLF